MQTLLRLTALGCAIGATLAGVWAGALLFRRFGSPKRHLRILALLLIIPVVVGLLAGSCLAGTWRMPHDESLLVIALRPGLIFGTVLGVLFGVSGALSWRWRGPKP